MEAQKDVFERLRESAKYRKMAVNSLLPGEISSHMDVIENEFKNMFREVIVSVVKSEFNRRFEHEEDENCTAGTSGDTADTKKHTRKVNIE